MATLGMSIISKKVISNNVNDDLVNEKIRFKEVMVIDASGDKLGIKVRRKTLEIAYRQELDLLRVTPKGQPPVCKVPDYGCYRFEQQEKVKEARKKQHVAEIRPIHLSPVIDRHDFDTKMRYAHKWIEDGMKVKVDMRLRGRLITRLEIGKKTMNSFAEEISDIVTIEKGPILEGNTMSCALAPKKK